MDKWDAHEMKRRPEETLETMKEHPRHLVTKASGFKWTEGELHLCDDHDGDWVYISDHDLDDESDDQWLQDHPANVGPLINMVVAKQLESLKQGNIVFNIGIIGNHKTMTYGVSKGGGPLIRESLVDALCHALIMEDS